VAGRTVTVWFDRELLEIVENIAKGTGLKRSAVISALIVEGLKSITGGNNYSELYDKYRPVLNTIKSHESMRTRK